MDFRDNDLNAFLYRRNFCCADFCWIKLPQPNEIVYLFLYIASYTGIELRICSGQG